MRVRRRIVISGIVQGVGFRPFVHRLAVRHHLGGWVRNHPAGVEIEAEGEAPAVAEFLQSLTAQSPQSARIDECRSEPCLPNGECEFQILSSHAAGQSGASRQPFPGDRGATPAEDLRGHVAADLAPCDECLGELFDPANRRYRYPFIACAHCGPRYTMVRELPFDRERTTMVEFPLCAACEAEYHDPHDRRFHAQALACPACGPQLQLCDASGERWETADPVAAAAELLLTGAILAVKGLGGYHLACDATQARAVGELRRRKCRADRPFAVMVADLQSARELCAVRDEEAAALEAPERPIVLLRRRPQSILAEEVAPGVGELGLFLPYTPLHHLLLHDCLGRPLVMTSGNRAEEPIACTEQEAWERLRGIADYFLIHTREIACRCDDSVGRVVHRRLQVLRRSRGYVPAPLKLPHACDQPVLAVGGQLKSTIALGWGRTAVLSQHLGDLDDWSTYRAFGAAVRRLEQLFGRRAARLVHDAHPDYASTRYAVARAEQDRLPLLAVQHHHAHLVSCWVENELTQPVIGVIFDGTGYGTDGAIWGGEFLIGDDRGFVRAGRMRYVGLPGGEAAIREPWRMALAHLLDAGETPAWLADAVSASELRVIRQLLERGWNAPPTSSVGRLFDAAAALAGVRHRVSYEGQAAWEWEAYASHSTDGGSYPFDLSGGAPREVDTRPLVRALVHDLRGGIAREVAARRFHNTLVEIVAEVCRQLRAESGLDAVVLSGGVFMNRLLATEVPARLTADGFRVYGHHCVPANDGGLSLGQLAIAAAAEC
jgi:hydrogenase maturation protein HypF